MTTRKTPPQVSRFEKMATYPERVRSLADRAVARRRLRSLTPEQRAHEATHAPGLVCLRCMSDHWPEISRNLRRALGGDYS